MSRNLEVKIIGTACHQALVELLIRERKKRHLQQWKVAKRMGEYQSFIARIETGERRIDVCEFLAIAKAIGFDPGRAINRLYRTPPPE